MQGMLVAELGGRKSLPKEKWALGSTKNAQLRNDSVTGIELWVRH